MRKVITANTTAGTVRDGMRMTGAPPGMSLEAMVWALHEAPEVPAQALGVLMAMADAADEHGCGSFYAAATLAVLARKSERQVRYDIQLLIDAKLIRPGDQSLAAYIPANRRPVVYDLAMDLVPGVQPIAPLEDNGTSDGVQSTAGQQPIAPLADVQPIAPLEDNGTSDGVQSTAPQDLGVQPIAYNPKNTSLSTSVKARPVRSDPNADREDIRRLCAHLADVVAANGFTRPTTTKSALDAARLMLDRDGRTEEQVHKAIDWSAQDGFWYKNVRSMVTLREKYERLQADAMPSRNGQRSGAPAASRVSPRDEHRMRR